jgi:hypothetical protein
MRCIDFSFLAYSSRKSKIVALISSDSFENSSVQASARNKAR